MTGKQKVTLSFGDKATMIIDQVVEIDDVTDIQIYKFGYICIKTDSTTRTYATDSLVGTVATLMEDEDETV